MAVRLGSVATQVDAEILLVDEVLAVGDASFQQKCFEAFQRMKDAGRTILLVTHDLSLVERFCDRAMLLERGRVLQMGDPGAIGRLYNEVNFGRLVPEGIPDRVDGAAHSAEITACWFESGGEQITDLAQGGPLEILTEVRFNEAVDDPVFAVSLRNDVGHTVFTTSTQWREQHTGRFEAGEVVLVRVGFDAWIGPSRYRATPRGARRERRQHDRPARGPGVDDPPRQPGDGGLIDPPHTVDVERITT